MSLGSSQQYVFETRILSSTSHAAEPMPAKERRFRLTYSAKILEASAGAKVRAWIPVPSSSDEQSVKSLTSELPVTGEEGTENKFGNKTLSFETTAPKTGAIAFSTSYQITRKEVHGLPAEKGGKPVKLTDQQRKLLLSADAKIPIKGKPLELL